MPITNLTNINSSLVYVAQNSYTSMELYYAILALLSIFLTASLFLSGNDRPFEKLFAAIMALIFSGLGAMESFSLAIMDTAVAGSIVVNNTTQNSIIPVMIMQNNTPLQVVSWILVLMCFINIVNCILVLMDYSRIRNVPRGAL